MVPRSIFCSACGVVLVIAVLQFSGCDAPDDDVRRELDKTPPITQVAISPPPPATQGYVGSAACTECHAGICEQYSQHPMGQSLGETLAASPIELESQDRIAVQSSSDGSVQKFYRVEQTDLQEFHHVIATADGEQLYDLKVPIDYAVGSGKRGRSYLTNRNGRIYMSALSWYSHENVWDLSPGYHHGNFEFTRRVTDRCLNCHAGRPNNIDDQANVFNASHPLHEQSIGCERCHGPAADHISFHQGSRRSSPDRMINPAKLEARRRDDVCLQCHLLGEERVTRYGRTDYDFRPGDLLTDTWVIFSKTGRTSDGEQTEAVSQAEQMLSSTCYVQSAGRLGCVSCHNPHRVPEAEKKHGFYREKCQACHAPDVNDCSESLEIRLAIANQNSCIDCHMPKLSATDIPHTSQTDHTVSRRPGQSSGSHENRSQPSGAVVFREDIDQIPKEELDRARAILWSIQAESSHQPLLARNAARLLQSWLENVADDLIASQFLGRALKTQGDFAGAADTWMSALERHPQNEELLAMMLNLSRDARQFEAGERFGRQLVELNPWESSYFEALAIILHESGKLPESIKMAERALELDPTATYIHEWLAEDLKATGDLENAARHKKMFDLLSTLPEQ